MTLDEFVEDKRRQVEAFLAWYKAEQALAGDQNWPSEMGVADWEEQFLIFVSLDTGTPE